LDNQENVKICRFCSKLCKNDNSLRNHERLCKSNPNYSENIKKHFCWPKGKPTWNASLTADTDERVKFTIQRAVESQSIDRLNHPEKYTGRGKTTERELDRRNKLSTVAKKRQFGGLTEGSGRGKKGRYKGYYCDSTYELVWIIYNLDHGITFKRNTKAYIYEYNGKKHKYYPDFELEDKSLVELKGYHTDLVDVKIAAVKDVSITVLYLQDLQYAFDWVKQHYTYRKLEDLYDLQE